MVKTLLKMFDAQGGETLLHFIDTKNDATYITDVDEEVLFKIDSSGNLYNGTDVSLGAFHMNGSGHWYYKSNEGHATDLAAGNDLLKAERMFIQWHRNYEQAVVQP